MAFERSFRRIAAEVTKMGTRFGTAGFGIMPGQEVLMNATGCGVSSRRSDGVCPWSGKWFFAFKISEYAYKKVRFTKHKSMAAAMKASAVKFTLEVDSVCKDATPEAIEGAAALSAWAVECEYEIDWYGQVMTYVGK